MKSLTDGMLKAMDDCGETLYRIAKDSGLSYPVVYNFYHGTRDIKLATANKLAKYFNLELRPRRRGGK